jgi:hypothetical protein
VLHRKEKAVHTMLEGMQQAQALLPGPETRAARPPPLPAWWWY